MSLDREREVPTLEEQAAYRVRHYRRPDPVNWRVRGSSGPDPWTLLTSTDLLPWWAENPAATCSEKAAKAIAWLSWTFAR